MLECWYFLHYKQCKNHGYVVILSGPKAPSGGTRGCFDDNKHCSVSGSNAAYRSVQVINNSESYENEINVRIVFSSVCAEPTVTFTNKHDIYVSVLFIIFVILCFGIL